MPIVTARGVLDRAGAWPRGRGFELCAAARRRAASSAGSPMTPVLSVKELMEHIVDPQADYVFDAVGVDVGPQGVVETKPTTDEDWTRIERGAWVLAESSNLLKLPRKMAPDDVKRPGGPGAPGAGPARDRGQGEGQSPALELARRCAARRSREGHRDRQGARRREAVRRRQRARHGRARGAISISGIPAIAKRC